MIAGGRPRLSSGAVLRNQAPVTSYPVPAGVGATQEESGMTPVSLGALVLLPFMKAPLKSDDLLLSPWGPPLDVLSPGFNLVPFNPSFRSSRTSSHLTSDKTLLGLCFVSPLPSQCSRPMAHFSVSFAPLLTCAALRHTFADWLGAIPCPVFGAAQHRHPVRLHHVARDALVCHSFVVSEVIAQPEAIGWNPRVATVYD